MTTNQEYVVLDGEKNPHRPNHLCLIQKGFSYVVVIVG